MKKKRLALPTHTCFDDALDLLVEFFTHRPDVINDLRLVHAECTAPDGHYYAHAWLEDTVSKTCMFDVIVNGKRRHVQTPRDEYYQSVGLRSLQRYTWRQARLLNLMHRTYGPWVPYLIALCKDSGAEFPPLEVSCPERT